MERERAQSLVPEFATVVKSTVNSSIGSAASIVLNSLTTLLEVQAKNGDVFMRTDGTATTATDGFEARVQEGNTRVYTVRPGVTLSIIGSSASVEATVIEYARN